MTIPHAERAEVNIRKLRDYCLDLDHQEGKHKARLFAAALGITVDDAEDLRRALLEMIGKQDAQMGRRDEYGQRYTVDFMFEWRGKQGDDSEWVSTVLTRTIDDVLSIVKNRDCV